MQEAVQKVSGVHAMFRAIQIAANLVTRKEECDIRPTPEIGIGDQ